MAAAIQVADLSYSYPPVLPGREPQPVLRRLSLTVDAGDFVALMGPVGAGKTTLCMCLNGLVPKAIGGDFAGSISVNGRHTRESTVAEIAAGVGMVFQDAEVQLFNASVEDEIAFGLEGLGYPSEEIERRIDWALESVGLRGFRQRSPRTLSGEQKRLAIATVLALAPPILVLDEPTAGLDPRGQADVLAVIAQLAEQRQATVIMATQDAEIVARHADRLLVLDAGEIILDGAPADLFAQLAAQPASDVSLPQLAVLAHLIGAQVGASLRFTSPAQACPIVARLWSERAPAHG